ncbi:probable drug/proton antiporter Yhk8p [Trichomonascus vanleenenianus]|uniref:MFS transporter n=1 Tax=Trichomonascus vanleenenianus TaxID=2268995 RepID=UPI003ECA76D8
MGAEVQETTQKLFVEVGEAAAFDCLVVDWDGVDDKENVRNMSLWRKWVIVLLMTVSTMELTFVNSAWSTTNDSIRDYFQCPEEVAILGIAVFVFALALGPLLIAPASEFYGRRPVYFVGFLGYIAFQVPTAFGKNIETIIIGRFFSGFFGSVFLSNVPGTISDIFDKQELGLPMSVYSLGPFAGPGIGPLIGGFIVNAYGWRWVYIVLLIISGGLGALVMLFVPETYAPVLKSRKAKRLRKETGNQNLYAEFDKMKKKESLMHSIASNCKRPVLLLVREPMMMVLCFYTSYLMAIIYLFMTAFPMVFQEVYGFGVQYVGLSFLGLTIGMCVSVAATPLWERMRNKAIQDNGGVSEPEMRTLQMTVGGFIVPISLFMFAWTIYPSVHWMVPIIASGIFGLATNWTFAGILSYTVEAYRLYAASAMGANVCIRCMVSTAFTLFGRQMMHGMGFHWAMTLIALVTLVMAPSGLVFAKYGRTLRMKSRFAQ